MFELKLHTYSIWTQAFFNRVQSFSHNKNKNEIVMCRSLTEKTIWWMQFRYQMWFEQCIAWQAAAQITVTKYISPWVTPRRSFVERYLFENLQQWAKLTNFPWRKLALNIKLTSFFFSMQVHRVGGKWTVLKCNKCNYTVLIFSTDKVSLLDPLRNLTAFFNN